MMNKNLFKSFQITWFVATTLGVVPFDYDRKTNTLSPTKWPYKKLVSFISAVLFLYKTTSAMVLTAVALENWQDQLTQLCMLSFNFCIFYHVLFMQLSFWIHYHRFCWVFNQVTSLAGMHNLHKRYTLFDIVMLSWIPTHINVITKLIVEFFENRHQSHYVYSYLPQEGQEDGRLLALMALVEVGAIVAFPLTAVFEFSAETFLIQGFTDFSDEIRKSAMTATTPRLMHGVILRYRALQIIIREFCVMHGRTIERTKSGFTFNNVMYNFCLIKFHSQLSPDTLAFVLNACIFTGTLPVLLYNSAFEIHENSCDAKREAGRATCWIGDEQERQALRKEIRSLKPAYVKVAGMYFLDRSMTPMYYRVITDYTVTALVTA